MQLRKVIDVVGLSCISLALLFATPTIASGQLTGDWFEAGEAPEDYDAGGDPTVPHGSGDPAYLISTSEQPKGFGNWMFKTKAHPFLEKRIRLSAYIKTEGVMSYTLLWIRLDSPDREVLAFYNMDDRPIQGTTDWRRYDIVLDVPAGSDSIALGFLMNGKGKTWVNGMTLESVGTDVPVSRQESPFGLYIEGDYLAAAAKYELWSDPDTAYIYNELFHFLSLYRADRKAEALDRITKYATTLKGEEWIQPVVKFYAGEVPEEKVLEAAKSSDAQLDRDQRCEALYYVSMAYLLEMEHVKLSSPASKERARELLEACLKTAVEDFMEYQAAEVELSRMKP
ncbi:MAG: hypothetical protein KAJ12_10745 [Bacteroidetes bacterium]|nr:hypothetical protein [Bacteroidota bacterium]